MADPAQQQTTTLAQAIRAKYPGTYDDMTDAALEQKVLAKYPQYADMPRTNPQPHGNAGTPEKPMVTPLPGEDFAATMKRGIEMAKHTTPAQMATAEKAVRNPKTLATVLTGAALSGPALLGLGVMAPEMAAAGAGGGVLGGTAAGATAGGGTALIGKGLHAAAGEDVLTAKSAADVSKSMIAGGATGGALSLLSKGLGMLPSATRAGRSLQGVKTTAGSVPIDTSKPGDTALQLYEQSQRGAVLPKSVRQFVLRVTTPDSPPITYAEAKDFQSNISRLSANERMNLNPNTARLVGQLNADLKVSLKNAADVVGKGQQFTQAMKEYHNAMRLKGFTDAAIKTAIGAAIGGLGVAGAKTVWDALTPKP